MAVFSLAAVAILGAAVVIAARSTGGGAPSEGSLRTITIEGEPANFTGEINLYHARENEFQMATGLYFFEPTIIVAPPRTQMIIEMENESVGHHTFTVPELGIDREFQAFDIQPFLLVTPGPGTYVFYCRFHADRGMRGAIRVGGPAQL